MKLPLLLISIVTLTALAFGAGIVNAEESTPSGIKRFIPGVVREKIENRLEAKKDRIENRIEAKQEKREEIKEKVAEKREEKLEVRKERVRKAVEARWNVFNKLTERAEALLNKLQERIDRAKEAGKDVAIAEAAMTDAKAKLAEAKTKLSEIEAAKGTEMTKESFKDVQSKFQTIHKDLNAIKQDGAKIIRALKGFNSEKSKATTSAQPQ